MTLDIRSAGIPACGSLNGQTAYCDHLEPVPAAEHGPPRCERCLVLGLTWTSLWACLTCGWVACSDESPGGHARKHYEETDHAVVGALDGDTAWRWCYVHGRVA